MTPRTMRSGRCRSKTALLVFWWCWLYYILCYSCHLVVMVVLAMATSLPDGFIEERVADAQAVSATFVDSPKTGRPLLLLAAKSGRVSALENPDESSKSITILNLRDSICHNGERGVQSIVPHPDFDKNRWIYMFYTDFKDGCLEEAGDDTPQNVVTRFRMDPETLMLDFDNRQEIWRNTPSIKRNHNGGAMAFGNDGLLYITTGDSGVRATVEPLDNLHGCLLRLKDDGQIPENNPYTAQNGYDHSYRCADTNGRVPADAPKGAVCSEIYAHGFRNPFRLTMDPHHIFSDKNGSDNASDKVQFTIQDVGGNHYEEISLSGTDYAGAYYGWPNYEGPCRPGSLTDCPISNDDDNDKDGIFHVEPFYYYAHRSSEDGGCITGAAFVPKDLSWPREYSFLFVDFVFLEIYSLQEQRELECRSCSPPVPGYTNRTFYKSELKREDAEPGHERMTDAFFGPYQDAQALYILRRGTVDTVRRIRYTGSINKPPVPVIGMDETTYLLGATVDFDGSSSRDPEGDDLTYEWDFGDGSTFSANVRPSHTYLEPGEYRVTLTVIDTEGQAQEVSETVTIGVPPMATILSPLEDHMFFVGEILYLSGEAFDASGNPIPDDQLEWEVRQHHADHFHPFLSRTSGNDFDLYPAPEPEDFWAATNSFLEIIMYATDEQGLTTEVHRDILPRTVGVMVDSIPPGLNFVVDDYTIRTPERILSWVGFSLPVRVENQTKHKFMFWADGSKDMNRKIQLVQTFPDVNLLAAFCLVDGIECIQSHAFYESHGTCCSGICSEGQCVAEIQSATASPTMSPTDVATVSPTNAPSFKTTASPTVSPTASPTVSPADAPSSKTTASPTVSPTDMPTVSPMDTPSASPKDATSAPSIIFTDDPTSAPATSSPVDDTSVPDVSSQDVPRDASNCSFSTTFPTFQFQDNVVMAISLSVWWPIVSW